MTAAVPIQPKILASMASETRARILTATASVLRVSAKKFHIIELTCQRPSCDYQTNQTDHFRSCVIGQGLLVRKLEQRV
jgi:hypothetical protein